jgi:hypothetical protein
MGRECLMHETVWDYVKYCLLLLEVSKIKLVFVQLVKQPRWENRH